MLSKKSYALIDVREKTEYNSGQILGATNVPRRELEFRLSQLVPNKSTTIILYDNNDQRARLAAETLQRNGYTNIHVLMCRAGFFTALAAIIVFTLMANFYWPLLGIKP